MSDVETVARDLRTFLSAEVFLNRKPEAIGLDDDLVSMGMDSLSVLRLVLFLETRHGVEVGGEDILGEGLSTVREIAEHCVARGA
jgi:acyl carrier protein